MQKVPGWQPFAFERAITKIPPSLALTSGPAVTDKVGGDGSRSQARGVVLGAGSRVAGSPMAVGRSHPISARMVRAEHLPALLGQEPGPAWSPDSPLQGFGCITRDTVTQPPKCCSQAFPGLEGPCLGWREGGAAGPIPNAAMPAPAPMVGQLHPV